MTAQECSSRSTAFIDAARAYHTAARADTAAGRSGATESLEQETARAYAHAKLAELRPCIKYAPADVKEKMEEIDARSGGPYHAAGDLAHWMLDACDPLQKWVSAGCPIAGGDGEPIPPSGKQGTKPFKNWDDAAAKLHYTPRHLLNLRKPNKPLHGIKPAKDGTVRLPTNFCTARMKKYNSPKNRPQ